MINVIRNVIRDESGAAAAEYALILAVIGSAIGAAAFLLGSAVKTSIGASKTQVVNCTPDATTGLIDGSKCK
ncbi:MAG: Flp family type IVb pilin [Novosphingobium sp.]